MKRVYASAVCFVLGTAALGFMWRFGHRVTTLGPHGDTIMVAVAVTLMLSYAAAAILYASWRGSQRLDISSPLNPGMDAETIRLGVKAGVYGLYPGKSYRVIREIKDYYGTIFPVGMDLIFVRRDYLPYHGGHTVFFRPRPMYLQDEENADVLGALDQYLQAIGTLMENGQPGY